MANQEHLDLLKQGVHIWNRWRQENPSIEYVDLNGANLRHADLAKADLRWANMGRGDLREANLVGADLANAILNDTQFGKANLTGANLSGANMWWANFWNADLSRANLVDAELWHANLTNANCSQANFERADLTMAVLVETNLKHANLAGATVYGVAAWNAALEGAVQTDLVITQPFEPRITVDDLEIAQFMYLLLNHQKLRNVINAITERGVLILGRFGGGGLDLLQSMAARLREVGYLPIIFDFERPSDRDYTETVKTLVGLARFVVVDLSGPSVPQELYASVPFFDIPFVPIIESGRAEYSMFKDLLKYSWVLNPPVEFTSKEHLLEILLSKVVSAAEEKHRERQVLLKKLFPRLSSK
jgi:uncharacterized protein YjbI with pentapeptide repeats